MWLEGCETSLPLSLSHLLSQAGWNRCNLYTCLSSYLSSQHKESQKQAQGDSYSVVYLDRDMSPSPGPPWSVGAAMARVLYMYTQSCAHTEGTQP